MRLLRRVVSGVETIDAACEYGMWVRVVMFANEQKKGAQTLSTVGRRDGKLPLHVAVINEAPLSVLQVCSAPWRRLRLHPKKTNCQLQEFFL